MKKLYSCSAVADLLTELVKANYEIVTITEGTLGYGYMICIPPVDGWYHYIIREVYLNCWSCAHEIRRCVKLSKANQRMLNAM